MLQPGMRSIEDVEGEHVPAGLPALIDAHVHIFPHDIFSAVWNWFDENGWSIRYRLRSSEIFAFLFSRGISHVVALQYAHKPGIARQLNQYMARKCLAYPGKITGMATVFPGEEESEQILQEAFEAGLGGVKLHAHVQCFDMNSDSMHRIYECCRVMKKPLIMHIGREPKSSAYRCDPYQLCHAAGLEEILKNYPDLKICVPHLGFDELTPYRLLLEKYDTLWLDTAMVLTDYFPLQKKIELQHYRCERILYGSDFPNIPYAWDRELKALQAAALPAAMLQQITMENAIRFFDLDGTA
ncbi:MAG: amidohydrolase family protein [Desulfopila sp.]|jgi:predicted TIM-barrel fold metal-dependent hydrolase|nr:amidohydrolase family protein [Desulfopila sp.]